MMDFGELIGSYGFPIVVTLWLLWERRSSMKELSDAINNHLVSAINGLKNEITVLNERVGNLK